MFDEGSLEEAVRQCVAWQRATFPGQNTRGRIAHLVREVVELAAAATEPGGSRERESAVAEEVADCFMLLVGIAADLHVNLADAVLAKLAINRARKWKAPNADGSVEHEP